MPEDTNFSRILSSSRRRARIGGRKLSRRELSGLSEGAVSAGQKSRLAQRELSLRKRSQDIQKGLAERGLRLQERQFGFEKKFRKRQARQQFYMAKRARTDAKKARLMGMIQDFFEGNANVLQTEGKI
jgi:hypothetical protein